MMYDRSAVNGRVRLTRRHRKLAEQYNPFAMSDESREELYGYVKTRRKGLHKAEYVADTVGRLLDYDYNHAFGGIRTAEEAWRDRRGHCIEINILLHRALHEVGINAGMIVVKNPSGYSAPMK